MKGTPQIWFFLSTSVVLRIQRTRSDFFKSESLGTRQIGSRKKEKTVFFPLCEHGVVCMDVGG